MNLSEQHPTGGELLDEEGAQVSGPFPGEGGTGTEMLIVHQSSAR